MIYPDHGYALLLSIPFSDGLTAYLLADYSHFLFDHPVLEKHLYAQCLKLLLSTVGHE